MGFILLRVVFLSCLLTLSFLPLAARAVTAVDLGTSAGLPARLPSIGESAILDHNDDGLADILFSAHGQEWPLLRQGPAGKFSRILPGTFSSGQDRHGCATADFNRDGQISDSDRTAFMAAWEGGAPTPCAADLSLDGGIDVDDLLIYLDQWFPGLLEADLAEPSGSVDIDDLLEYLNRWFAGC